MRRTPDLDVFVNLLQGFMFVCWMTDVTDEDGSFRDTMAAARAELERCGVTVPDQAQFERQLEATLQLEPREFVQRLNALKP